MRIAYISYEFPPDNGKGGIGTYVSQMASLLASLGCQVHVFSGSPIRSGSESIDGYSVHRVQCTDPFEFRTKIAKCFMDEHKVICFDLMESPEIHGNAWEIKKSHPTLPLIIRLHAPNFLVEKLKRRYVPFFAKFRFFLGAVRRLKWDLGYWRSYSIDDDLDYQFLQLADAITTPSRAMKEWAVKFWKIHPDKISVLPNIFVPQLEFLKIPIPNPLDCKTVVFFGRLNVLKGLVNATVAMKKILVKYPDWKFKVIGDDGNGPDMMTTMRHWMKKKLKKQTEQVEFMDSLDYELIPSALTKAEIVLLPSLFESYSYTCIEAMAAGKAVIGSKNGGMKELINDGKNGLLIDPESSKEIFLAVEKLIKNRTLRNNLAFNAREKVLSSLDSKKTVTEILNFYRNVIGTLN